VPVLHRSAGGGSRPLRADKTSRMSTIVKAATAADFLAVVPRLVGFEPSDSIVFVAFRGRRTCGAIRFDLPEHVGPSRAADDTERRFHRRVATTLVGTLSKLPGVDAVVPVVYTDEAFADAGRAPRAAFVREVTERLEFSGFLVRDALCIAADGWGSYLDPDCPADGRPLAAIAQSRVLDDLPPDQHAALEGVAERAALPAAGVFECERVAALVRRFGAVIDRDVNGPDGDFDPTGEVVDAIGVSGPQLSDIPLTLERILRHDPGSLDPVVAAFVIAVVRSPAMRDVVMLQWAFNVATGERVLADARRFAVGAPADELDSAVLMLWQGPRPAPDRVETAVTLLKRVTALAPARNRPPLYCMLAWLNWALGRSSVANEFVSAAEAIDADYGLAEVMRAVLERGMLPEWAFADER